MIANLKEDEQHQHKNPDGTLGGWIANTAKVAPSCYVGKHALVYGHAVLTDEVCVVDSAQVSGSAHLSGDVIVSGNCWVSGTTKASTGRIWKNERVSEKQTRIR
jgi:UDP-3-O-[3-hydroxymyristoyl] glucosamine N-acyltransferase